MDNQKTFYKSVITIALPVTLQSLLQSSFSVIDQIMIGKLGSSSIAGVGLGAKFSSMYSVILSAIAAVTGIMVSQYIGKKDEMEVNRSFFANLFLAAAFSAVFSVACFCFPEYIMGFYTKDIVTRHAAAGYLRITALSFLPLAASMVCSAVLRCLDAAKYPLYATAASVILNTCLNYVLIFGKAGMPEMGVNGAAFATVISQAVSFVLVLFFMVKTVKRKIKPVFVWRFTGGRRKQYLKILLPIIACEFFWSLGENIYTAIYGNIGTEPCAAMTLTIPLQTLLIGALSGLSQAAGIIIGKSLGSREYNRAYKESQKIMLYALCGSALLSVILLFSGKYYVQIYNTSREVRETAFYILVVFALVSPVKVQNMVLGGGILRSGGKTKYIMCIDFMGTWLFGVPLGYLGAFVLNLGIPYVYLLLSLEECVRLAVSLVLFKKKYWMESLE
ncbi:MAG: MATE family efflux transporter [Lachnospiraceae bacterium]|nr:MATE family efflux transporter [Lachnospiraceae bacterium]